MGGGKYDTNSDTSNVLYDDKAFQLFLLAFLAVYWIPAALLRLSRLFYRVFHKKTPLEKAKEGWCECRACQKKKAEGERKERPNFVLPLWDIVFVLITAVLIYSSYKVYHTNLATEPPFDPFAILGVSQSATKREIQKAYRKLSIVHHPDKNLGDPTAGERFIRITKAFAALTDEASKENYIKYGNPDGYMGTTLGLGLPEWVAEKKNAVLLSYCILVVLVFPGLVGIWWHQRSKQWTSEVMTNTFFLYRETLQQSSRFRDMLGAFASSFEFENLYKSEYTDKVTDLVNTLRRVGKFDIRKTAFVMEPTPAQLQNLVILSARVARVPIPPELQPMLDAMLEKAEPLLTALTDTVGAFQRPDCEAAWNSYMKPHGHTVHLISCLRLTQCIFQGTDEKDTPLLQLPHFTEREVKYCTTSRTTPARSVYDFMRLQREDQRKLLRSFSEEKFQDVIDFCDRYPQATLTSSGPTVEDEEDATVHEGDTVTIRAKLRVMRRKGSVFSPHTPSLPSGKTEIWWVWLADQRLNCPVEVRRLLPTDARGHNPDAPKVDSCCNPKVEEKFDDGELEKDPRVTVYDLKFTFSAPRAGRYDMELVAAVDCYHGCSKTLPFVMNVAEEVEPPAEDNVRYFDTDDESEEEEEEEEESGEEDGEETDAEYEYIEVTDDEDSEEDSDDILDISGASGDPTSSSSKKHS